MTIEHPMHSDIPALQILWKEAFSDTDAFLDLFFTQAFALERALVAKEGETVLGALYWFYCAWEGNQSAYIYAVATKKEYRGRGICRALMEKLHSEMTGMGKSTILVPADDGLRAFYARMGYRDFGGMDEKVYHPGDASINADKLTVSQYMQKRRMLLMQGGVLQEGDFLPILSETLSFYGGKNWILAGYREGEMWICPEYLGDPKLLPGILKALEIPSACVHTAGEKPFAMCRAMAGEESLPQYFAFALD